VAFALVADGAGRGQGLGRLDGKVPVFRRTRSDGHKHTSRPISGGWTFWRYGGAIDVDQNWLLWLAAVSPVPSLSAHITRNGLSPFAPPLPPQHRCRDLPYIELDQSCNGCGTTKVEVAGPDVCLRDC